MPLTRDEDIYALLANTRTIAMVGASDRPDRPSYGVMAYLQSRGYRVLPVNPQITGEHVHGEYVWRELAQIGETIDLVDVFRRPKAAGEAVDAPDAAGGLSILAGPRPEDGRGQRPDGGIVGLEREGERSTGPADRRLGRRHDLSTIAPCRVSSSRKAATSLWASSTVSDGNFCRSAAARSGTPAGAASRSQRWLPVGFRTSALRDVR